MLRIPEILSEQIGRWVLSFGGYQRHLGTIYDIATYYMSEVLSERIGRWVLSFGGYQRLRYLCSTLLDVMLLWVHLMDVHLLLHCSWHYGRYSLSLLLHITMSWRELAGLTEADGILQHNRSVMSLSATTTAHSPGTWYRAIASIMAWMPGSISLATSPVWSSSSRGYVNHACPLRAHPSHTERHFGKLACADMKTNANSHRWQEFRHLLRWGGVVWGS